MALGLFKENLKKSHDALFKLCQAPFVICTFIFLRLAKDDWSNLSALRSVPLNLQGLETIVTNEWCCGFQRRLFFISWIPQWLISHLGAQAPTILTAFIVLILFLTGQVTYKIFITLFNNIGLAALLSLICAWGPVAIVVGSVGNNLFFTIPMVITCYLILNIISTESVNAFLLFFLIFLLQFSGELTTATGYFLAFASLFRARQKKNELVKHCVAIALNLIIFLSYLSIVAGPRPTFHIPLPREILNYLRTWTAQDVQILNVLGEYYPFRMTQFSTLLLLVGVLIGGSSVFFLFLIQKTKQPSLVVSDEKRVFNIAVILVAFISTFPPLIYGIASGLRPGPELRYHQMSFFVSATILGYLINQSSTLKRWITSELIAVIMLCIICFMSASALNSKIGQANLDKALWSRIYSVHGEFPSVVVTFNPYNNYPMPPYYSLADSDFFADWGIGGYIKWKTNSAPKVLRDIKCEDVDRVNCIGFGYYGSKENLGRLGNYTIVYVGSDYEIKPKNVYASDFLVTDSFELFQNYRNQVCRDKKCQ